MRVVIELNIEETVSTDTLETLGNRVVEAISGPGPRVHPRLLIEMTPTYLELPLHPKPSKV